MWALHSFFARVHAFPEHTASFRSVSEALAWDSSRLRKGPTLRPHHCSLCHREMKPHHLLFPGVIVHGGCVSLPSPASTWFSPLTPESSGRKLSSISFQSGTWTPTSSKQFTAPVTEMPSEVLRAPNKSNAAWRRETLACASATRTSGLFPGSACTFVDGEELSFVTLLFGAGWTFVGQAFEGEVGVVPEWCVTPLLANCPREPITCCDTIRTKKPAFPEQTRKNSDKKWLSTSQEMSLTGS